jgi:hypothetical protein
MLKEKATFAEFRHLSRLRRFTIATALLDHPCGGIAADYQATIEGMRGISTWTVDGKGFCIPPGAMALLRLRS